MSHDPATGRFLAGTPGDCLRCTPETIAAIVTAYEAAPRYTPLVHVLGDARIAKRTYYDWRARAEAGEAPFLDGVARVEAARRAHLAPLAEKIATLATSGTKDDATQLRAALWLLEKLGGAAWNPPARAEVTGKDGGAIQAEVVAKVVVLPALEPDDEPADPVGAEPGAAD